MDFLQLEKLISQELQFPEGIFFSPNNDHADLSTNALFIIGKQTKQKPTEVFEQIKSKLNNKHIKNISIAKNGFLNIHTSDYFLIQGLQNINKYNNKNETNNIKVNVEFVSANPTGPLHYGNSRSVYGDALANILDFAGYNVTKEYYVNDAGNQINLLADSVFSEYLKLQNMKPLEMTEFYKGDYIKGIAEEIYKSDKNKWNHDNYKSHFKKFSIEKIIDIIKEDLISVGIRHDVWTYESDITKHIPQAFKILEAKGLIYQGELGSIQSNKGEESGKILTLFRSSKFGDEDRALTKPDGSHTYFANDIAYFYDKIQRGFKWLIIVLGADHDGYLKRLKAAVSNLDSSIRLDMKTCQIVLFKQNGENVKISKRSGNALGLRESVTEIGKDMFRFLMLSKSLDTHYSVDTDKIVELSMSNPFYYSQYAHARMCSIIRDKKINLEQEIDVSHLTDSMIKLIKILLEWNKCIESITRTLEVHKMINYITKISEQFHSIWNEGKINSEHRWITDDINITNSRLIVVSSTRSVLSKAFNLLGITAYQEL